MSAAKEPKCACCQHQLGNPAWVREWEDLTLCEACFALPKAVSLLVERSDGTVLGVSRKYDHTKFGLPGGKMDPGETSLEAIRRETFEETGLRFERCARMFIAVCPGGPDGIAYMNIAFRTEYVDLIGPIHTDEPHVVEWITRDTLLAGPFKTFNRKLFDFLAVPESRIAREALERVSDFVETQPHATEMHEWMEERNDTQVAKALLNLTKLLGEILCHVCGQPKDGYGGPLCSVPHAASRLKFKSEVLTKALGDAMQLIAEMKSAALCGEIPRDIGEELTVLRNTIDDPLNNTGWRK